MGAKGIDIFRVYQSVWSWQQVAADDVEFCWIKATHGLGIATFNADRNYAPAPADPTVEGARSVGIAPGLYHWGKGNDPEDEADVFAGEVIRLGCRGPGTLPPALDAEDASIGPTWAARRAWCIAFLKRLQERIGQQRVAIYMNASWAAALRPDQWDIPGLIIWIAAYGANTGQRSTRAVTDLYDGRADVQQFTSLGLHLVDGITSNGLDVNEADTALEVLLEGDDEMTDVAAYNGTGRMIRDAADAAGAGPGENGRDNFDALTKLIQIGAYNAIASVLKDIKSGAAPDLAAIVQSFDSPDQLVLDPESLQTVLAKVSPELLAVVANAVNDEADRRRRDDDPETGPRS